MSQFIENLEAAVKKINAKLEREGSVRIRTALKAERKELEAYITKAKA